MQIEVNNKAVLKTAGKYVAEDITIIAKGGNLPQLFAPSISLSGNTLTITPNTSNGGFSTDYSIYDGSTFIKTVTTTTVDLSTVFAESTTQHTVTVQATADNFQNSAASNSVTYANIKTYTITTTVTGFTPSANNPTSINTGEQKTLNFTLNDGYEFPEDNPTVTGASFVSWTSSGALTIKNPTANVTITITATKLPDKLATPTNVTADGTTVSWDEVENATSYDIYVDGAVYETINSSPPSNIITVSTTKEGAYSTSIVNETFMPQVGDRLAQWITYWGERGFGYQPYFGFNVYSNDTFNTNNASVDFSSITTDQNGSTIAINDYVYFGYCGWTSNNRLISGSINALKDLEASNILILIQGYNKAISIADNFDMEYGTINCTVPEDVQLPFNFIFAVKGDYTAEFTITDSDGNLFGGTTTIIATLPNKFDTGGDTGVLGALTITNQNIVTDGSLQCAAVIGEMLGNEMSNNMAWVIPAGISTLQNQITVSDFSFSGYAGDNLFVYIITMEVVTFTIETGENGEFERYTECQGPANMLFSAWISSAYNTQNIVYPVAAEDCPEGYVPIALSPEQTIPGENGTLSLIRMTPVVT